MARGHNRKGRSKYPDRYMTVFYYFVESPAWRSLDTYARSVYFELRYRYNGRNNGGIAASVRELAKAINCSNRPIIRALQELQDRGFIIAVQKGSFNWKTRIDGSEKNRATVWLLTELPQNEPVQELTARKDFMKWEPKRNDLKEKKADVSVHPYRCASATIGHDMGAEKQPMVLLEHPSSPVLEDGSVLKGNTYNIPYTPTKNINGMGG